MHQPARFHFKARQAAAWNGRHVGTKKEFIARRLADSTGQVIAIDA